MSQNGQGHFKNLAANAVSDHFGTSCIKELKGYFTGKCISDVHL